MQHIEQAAQTQQTFGERWAARVGRAAARRPRAHIGLFAASTCLIPLILLPLVAPGVPQTYALSLIGFSVGCLLLTVGWIWRNRRDYWRIVERERPGALPTAAEPIDPGRARRERRLEEAGRDALKNPRRPALLAVFAAVNSMMALFWYAQASGPNQLMWMGYAITTLIILGSALSHFEVAAFYRIIERQRAGAAGG